MNKLTHRSLSFMVAVALLLGSFFSVKASSASSGQMELGQIPQVASAASSLQTQAFTDNFDNFNSSFWKSGYVWGPNDINMGNGNPANLSIVQDTDGSYLCLKSPAVNNIGVVTSVNQFSYGTYTARMKFTASNGTWPSFWALSSKSSWEIDAHESIGNDPTRHYMTLHDNGEVGQGVYKSPVSLADQWHTYSYTWTATDVTFYFDNVMRYSQAYSKPDLMSVMFTMGIMGDGILWSGNHYDSTTFANGAPTLCVDYFSFTPSTTPPPSGPSDTPMSSTAGVFRPSNGLLYLKNSNQTGFADVAINYGTGGDYPIAGDWDGNGTATIGIYRNGFFYLRNSNSLGVADLVFAFGTPGDQPIAGDWNGDGIDTIGVYRRSTGQFLLRNSNTSGAVEKSFYLGNVGDVGIAGDWDGDGTDTTGVFRPSNGVIFLKNANRSGYADISLNYGVAGDQPVTGDWDGDGIDTIGIYRNSMFLLRNSNTPGFADITFSLGNPGDVPIAGNWDGPQ